MKKIKIIVGSVRQRRFAEKTVPWILENLDKQNKLIDNDKFEVEVLDLKDWEFPFFSEVSPMTIKNGDYRLDIIKRWSEKIKEADAFIFISPEYNKSVTSVLKNAIDYLFYEWQYKPFGIVSYGEVGGANSVQALRLIGIELRMIPVKQAVQIMDPWTLRDEQGELKGGILEKYNSQFEQMFKDLLFYTEKLKK